MPDFLGNKWHHRMQKPYRSLKQADQILARQKRRFFIGAVLGCQTGLNQLKIPVAKLAPEEIVNSTSSVIEAIRFQCLANFLSNSIEAREYPAIFQRDRFKTCNTCIRRGTRIGPQLGSHAVQVHKHEARCIPDLVSEISIARGPAGIKRNI